MNSGSCSHRAIVLLVCGFEVCSSVLNFTVIGQYTINIPDIFQVFTVFAV